MSSSPEIPPQHRILSSMGNVAVFYAAYAGLSVERVSTETGVPPSMLMNPDTYLPEAFFEKFFKLLADSFPSRNVALELAQIAPLSYLGAPGRLLRCAPDLRSMLELFSRHCDLIADRLEMEVVSWGKAETVLRTHQPLSFHDGGMSAEIGLGMGTRIAQECFGEKSLLRAQFRHQAVGPQGAYEEFFKAPVSFGAQFNALIFDSRILDVPSRAWRVENKEVLELRLKGLRQDIVPASSGDEVAAIRQAVMRNALKGDYSASGLARSMGMSLSSLQRRLHEAGTSASRLIDEARHVNALGLLADSSLSVDEAAFRLGFESERGFRKAFRRWCGKSPAAARKEMA
ncbi:AraC family transcriptional regulator ligand-binding domain-containing protein [Candidatus Electronema sp. JM]|uniref:AraC family transcriptional regulator n=1 Tax=Candidatus Electronema sp. JM TaxID=3401571 RepID=UPI003AA8DA21